jgi:hypothetical protein
MGIYDPTFQRKEFVAYWRDGEIPGSLVLGKGKLTNKGCVWQGQGGRWFASIPPHHDGEAYPSFDSKEEAMAYVIKPHHELHEVREDHRGHEWVMAAPKREKRMQDRAILEAKKVERYVTSPTLKRMGQHVFVIRNAEGAEVGRVVRKTVSEARLAGASLLGMKLLPEGYIAEQVSE